MSDQWSSHLCKVTGTVASILLNLRLRESAPDLTRPWLLFVRLYFKHPRPDGLSSQEEFDDLVAIEDKLVPIVEELCCATFAGTISTQGRREFYFYGSRPIGLKNAGRQIAALFNKYKFQGGKKEDVGWRHFLDCMCPLKTKFRSLQG